MKTTARNLFALCPLPNLACRCHTPWVAVLAICLFALFAVQARAQSPGLLWSTNLGATLFAVDAQTNTYANSGGTVIKLNGAGVPIQTNAICPLPGIARRDVAGNYYFLGSFDGTQNFGGITLVGGWYTPGYPTCFTAKYDSNGSLQWATSFGRLDRANIPTDLLLDDTGACYAGYSTLKQYGIARISASGSVQWGGYPALGGFGSWSSPAVKLGGVTSSNCGSFSFSISPFDQAWYASVEQVSIDGSFTDLTPLYDLRQAGWQATNARPVIDDLAQVFALGRDYFSNTPVLRKFSSLGVQVWNTEVTAEAQWLLARDPASNVYVAGTNGMLAKFDNDGFFVWSNNFSRQVIAMVVDASGNRFLSLADGGVARLAADPTAQSPFISTDPQPQTVFSGGTINLLVTAGGTQPLKYFWRLNGTNILGGTNAAFVISNAVPTLSGNYTVVITNSAGAITSAPALVRVKAVQLYYGNQMLTNGTYVFASAPTLNVHSTFAGGSIFYTLDGSPPDFTSTFYSGPFAVPHNATVRALGYSSDFSKSDAADAVMAVVLENHTLTASASVGGSVALSPPGGVYVNTNLVTATALPSGGWAFLYWLGDATGTNPIAPISTDRDKAIHAVFGTTLSTTVAGNGQIQLFPPGVPYPYGTSVRLTAIPDSGNFFGFWGNAATGNTNPLTVTITAPAQTVSAIFGATPVGQAALTVLINGHGLVNPSPRSNSYALNQPVTLTAVPDPGQTFLNWSGDASGSQNPLPLTMTAGKVITANFTTRPALRVDRHSLEGPTPEGFRVTLVSDPSSVYQLFGSTNFTAWDYLATVTNIYGELQFLDRTATNAPEKFYKATP